MKRIMSAKSWLYVTSVVVAAVSLTGCAGSDKVKVADLVSNPGSVGVKAAWTASVGNVTYPLEITVHGSNIYVGGSNGVVAAIDGRTGGDVWRASLKTELTAGVGADARYAAVISRNNELVALERDREIWRQQLPAVSFTAPLVAGERMFVLSADRSVTAFDSASGKKLWSQARPADALVLQQAGVILAVRDTLVVGLGGRLLGLNPQSGVVRWEVPVANSRGTNEVERLVDLVSGVARNADQLCVRSFQSAVACIDTSRGAVLWNKTASGATGLSGDSEVVFGTEGDGNVVAWRRSDGDKLWVNDQLKFRTLSMPLLIGRFLAVGDFNGYVHFLSRDSGATLNRVPTDGSAVVAGPVLVGQTVVVVTRRGGIFGFRPE